MQDMHIEFFNEYCYLREVWGIVILDYRMKNTSMNVTFERGSCATLSNFQLLKSSSSIAGYKISMWQGDAEASSQSAGTATACERQEG